MESISERANFRAMTDATAADFAKIAAAGLPDRALAHMRLLEGDCGRFTVDRLQHWLQATTLAYRDGMDEEYVVYAVLHEIGDILCTGNHAELAATILQTYVAEENHWMLKHHGIFQGYFYFHPLGLDRNMREQFRAHPHFEWTALFCKRH